MTDLEIMQILCKAKELGITMDDINKYKNKTEVKDEPIEEIVKPLSALDDLSEHEILYYATPYFDEIQAKKEAQKARLTEEV